MNYLLSRKAKTTGGRDGIITTETSKQTLTMAKPTEMGGSKNTKTNPEELFSAGYSACFASSIEYLLSQSKISFEDIIVEANTMLVEDGDKGFKFKVELDVDIVGLDDEKKRMFANQAYAFCPYSKAIDGNVDVTIRIK